MMNSKEVSLVGLGLIEWDSSHSESYNYSTVAKKRYSGRHENMENVAKKCFRNPIPEAYDAAKYLGCSSFSSSIR
jgi:hypothetical protein